jgi:hypothetical protein
LVMVPSVMDSPIWGITTSVGMKVPYGDTWRWLYCRATLDYKTAC